MRPIKPCGQCGQVKTGLHTRKRVDGTSYRSDRCLSCRNKSARRRRSADRASSLITAAKSRAKLADLPFSLTKEDVVIPTHCPVLGIPFATESGPRSDNSPSIDRIRGVDGYVPGNIAVISWRANKLKSDATLEEIVKLAQFYIPHLRGLT